MGLNEQTQQNHSLELNLILYFLYVAGLKYGVSEFDVLRGAQQNTFGYLTEFQHYTCLKKCWYQLRPINVPFKNKWLRDTTVSLSPQVTEPTYHLVAERILRDLCLDRIYPVSKMTLNLVKKLKGGIANGYFDSVAAVAIVLKLLYGFNDVSWERWSLQERQDILKRAKAQD